MEILMWEVMLVSPDYACMIHPWGCHAYCEAESSRLHSVPSNYEIFVFYDSLSYWKCFARLFNTPYEKLDGKGKVSNFPFSSC